MNYFRISYEFLTFGYTLNICAVKALPMSMVKSSATKYPLLYRRFIFPFYHDVEGGNRLCTFTGAVAATQREDKE